MRIVFSPAAFENFSFLFDMLVSLKQFIPPQILKSSLKFPKDFWRSLCSLRILIKGMGICRVRYDDLFFGGVSRSPPFNFCAMYNCGKILNLDMSKRSDLEKFTDAKSISEENKEAVSWAVASGIFKGNVDGSFNPFGNVTRAEMSMVLRNWLNK